MYRKMKELMNVTVNSGKQSISMQRKLILYWIFMVLSIFAALLVVLSIAGVFSNSDKMLHRTLIMQQENTATAIEEQVNSITARGVDLSKQVGGIVSKMYYMNNVKDLSNQPEKLLNIQESLYAALNMALWGSPCSGAYFILDATTNTEALGSETSRTGMYLRYVNLSAKSSINPDVVYFRGIPDIARMHQIELHNRWNLEFDVSNLPGYEKIIGDSVDRAADSTVWSGRINLPETWEDIMLLMVPIINLNGTVQGVCGMEISDLYFRLSYPPYDSNFGNLITILAPIKDNKVMVEKGMIGGLDGVYFNNSEYFEIEEGKYFNTYTGNGETFFGIHEEIGMKFIDGMPVAVLTMIPSANYISISNAEHMVWVKISLTFLIVMLILSYFLSMKFVKPIVRSFSKMQNEEGFSYSGISEVDALMEYIINSKRQSKAITEGTLPPNIAELFTSFALRAKNLTVTERKILKYYIDGYEISQIPDIAFISINTVRKHNANIYQKMGVGSKDELMLYIELFRRCDRLEELYDVQDVQIEK